MTGAPRSSGRSHWAVPDIAGDILAIARRVDAAEPVEIRVRPELYRDLVGEPAGALQDELDGIPLVVDAGLPTFPGFEVHRNYGSRAA